MPQLLLALTCDRHGRTYENTRRAAHHRARQTADDDRAKALEVFRLAGPAGRTADQVAEALAGSPLRFRPRVTELKQQGLIFDTGRRGRNKSGNTAAILAIANQEPAL